MSKKEKIILPERYYHAYFVELIRFVQKHSGHLLFDAHQEFIDRFAGLSLDAQCLYVRMTNRRGSFFRPLSFEYPEITSIPAALDELHEAHFCNTPVVETADILKLFTKGELTKIFEIPAPIKREGKDVILAYIESVPFLAPLLDYDHVVELQWQEEVAYIRMLYFGDIHTEMTEFVIRDVGNVKLYALDADQFKPWFATRDEAAAVYEISHVYQAAKQLIGGLTSLDIHELLIQFDWDHFFQWPSSAAIVDKLAQRLAAQCERENDLELALYYYMKAIKPPARERTVRILNKLGRDMEADALINQMITAPHNAAELLFAKDFLSKSQARIRRSTTRRIKDAQLLTIPFAEGRNVELLALDQLQKQGYQGAHVENRLWRNLFGLVFWDILFDQTSGNFHHPLQRISDNLFDKRFYLTNEKLIRQSLKKLKTMKSWQSRIEKNHKKYFGINNPMVGWDEEYLHLMQQAIERLGHRKLEAILLAMAENVKDNSTGFPDLFVWRETEYMFYEVKSPNDQLSAQQLFWLDYFQAVGVNAEVLRISYLAD